MNRIKTLIILGLTVFLAVSFTVTSVFAASGNKPGGDPPYGLKVQGDAKGTKLIGVIYIELSDDPTNTEPCNGYNTLNAYVRLRQGADSATFTTETLSGCYGLATEEETQNEILTALRDDVIDYFFCNGYGTDEPCYTGMDIMLKDITDYGEITYDDKMNILMDIVLAAQ
jgi:hypothetical protein